MKSFVLLSVFTLTVCSFGQSFDPNVDYRLVAKHSGRVLDVNLPDRDQANVVQHKWHGGDNQRWRIEVVE